MIYKGKEYSQIPNFSGYFVSRDGEVLSTRYYNSTILRKPQLGTNGYLELSLAVGDGKFYRTGIHRLVALAYIPCFGNTDDLVVNHKNGNKLDNRVENLEWVTYLENAEHAGANGLTSKCIPIAIVTASGYEVTNFPSIISCARTLGYTKDTVNWRVKTRGKVLHSDGLYYMFEKDVDEFFRNLDKTKPGIVKLSGKKPVLLRDLNRDTVLTFDSVKAVANHLNVRSGSISTWLKAKNQPVLPGLIQLKFADDDTPWREVKDSLKELSEFTKTKIVLTKNKMGELKIYSSAVECCKTMKISPTCLSYRLRSKGSVLFSDGFYYMYREDIDGPINQ